MALTPAQLIAAILHQNTMELNLAATPFNRVTVLDVENYTALGLVAGTDTAKTLLKIVSPINTPVYENAGFAAGVYTSPDFEFLVSPVNSIIKTLPHVTGSNTVLAGTYVVYVKQQVVQVSTGTNVEVETSLFFTVCAELLRTPDLKATYNCNGNPPTFTITDNTSMAGADGFVYQSVTRAITISPPFGSGLDPVTGSSNPYTQSPLWTGTYGYSIDATITFRNGTDIIIVRYAGNGEQLVICNDILCRMYCCLVSIRKEYYAEGNASKKAIFLERLQLGLVEYQMAIRARACGDTTSESGYIDQFYKVTWCDPNCECAKTDAVAPVVPDCGCVNGENGKNIELQVNGTMVQWRVVGDLAWNDLFDTSDITGPTGPAGADGAALVHSDPDDHATTTNGSWETLSSFTTVHGVDAKTLKLKGDTFRLYARLEAANNPSASGISGRFIINGTGLVNQVIGGLAIGFSAASNGVIEMYADIILKDATAGAMHIRNFLRGNVGNDTGPNYSYTTPGAYQSSAKIQDVGGATVDFQANDYVISAQGFSKATADVKLVAFQIEKLKKTT